MKKKKSLVAINFLTLVPAIVWNLECDNIETQLDWAYFHCHQMKLASRTSNHTKKKKET